MGPNDQGRTAPGPDPTNPRVAPVRGAVPGWTTETAAGVAVLGALAFLVAVRLGFRGRLNVNLGG